MAPVKRTKPPASTAFLLCRSEEEDQSHHYAAKSDQPDYLLSAGEFLFRYSISSLASLSPILPADCHLPEWSGVPQQSSEDKKRVRLKPTKQAAIVFASSRFEPL